MPTPRKHTNDAARAAAYRQRRKKAREQELQAKGLPPLPPIPTMPGLRRWALLQQQAQATLETIAAEMQEYYDDRSESWQESDKGEEFQAKIDRVQAAIDATAEIDE